MPQEQITVGATQISPVYILSADDRWTRYMDGAHKVHIVRTEDLKSRELIATPKSAWRNTPYGLWRDWQAER